MRTNRTFGYWTIVVSAAVVFVGVMPANHAFAQPEGNVVEAPPAPGFIDWATYSERMYLAQQGARFAAACNELEKATENLASTPGIPEAALRSAAQSLSVADKKVALGRVVQYWANDLMTLERPARYREAVIMMQQAAWAAQSEDAATKTLVANLVTREIPRQLVFAWPDVAEQLYCLLRAGEALDDEAARAAINAGTAMPGDLNAGFSKLTYRKMASAIYLLRDLDRGADCTALTDYVVDGYLKNEDLQLGRRLFSYRALAPVLAELGSERVKAEQLRLYDEQLIPHGRFEHYSLRQVRRGDASIRILAAATDGSDDRARTTRFVGRWLGVDAELAALPAGVRDELIAAFEATPESSAGLVASIQALPGATDRLVASVVLAALIPGPESNALLCASGQAALDGAPAEQEVRLIDMLGRGGVHCRIDDTSALDAAWLVARLGTFDDRMMGVSDRAWQGLGRLLSSAEARSSMRQQVDANVDLELAKAYLWASHAVDRSVDVSSLIIGFGRQATGDQRAKQLLFAGYARGISDGLVSDRRAGLAELQSAMAMAESDTVRAKTMAMMIEVERVTGHEAVAEQMIESMPAEYRDLLDGIDE